MLHLRQGLSRKSPPAAPIFCFFGFAFRFIFIQLILFACGDIELYPDP